MTVALLKLPFDLSYLKSYCYYKAHVSKVHRGDDLKWLWQIEITDKIAGCPVVECSPAQMGDTLDSALARQVSDHNASHNHR